MLTTHLRSDGRHRDKLYVDGGPSTTQTVGHLRMAGKDVFRFAVGMVTDVIERRLRGDRLTAPIIDWFVPHQANRAHYRRFRRETRNRAEKVIMTVDLHGNTSAASIPLALPSRLKTAASSVATSS